MGLRLHRLDLFERPLRLRLPFRFGAATVTHAPQAFVRAELSWNGQRRIGASAELMVPKWFDKNPALTHEQNFEQLRQALRLARDAALAAGEVSHAHELSGLCADAMRGRADALGLPRLVSQFGAAQVDKAVADAVLRAAGLGWCDGLRAGVLGDPWSRTLPVTRAAHVIVRHTVGLADRLRNTDPGPDPHDGLPATLEAAIHRYGLTHFKLKLCGQTDADVQRLADIAVVLDGSGVDYRVTLDGNESFADVDGLAHTWQRLRAAPALSRLLARALLLEQPLPRQIALRTRIGDLALGLPVIIDESDDHAEAFDQALELGYHGISTKACKGIYRSIRNAALVAGLPAMGLLLSGEDLTCQAGLAVQQDCLLATSLGVTHIERNGHHYVDGFAGAPAAEVEAFAHDHAGLYHRDDAGVRLAVEGGRLDLRSLHGVGFGTQVHPAWGEARPIP